MKLVKISGIIVLGLMVSACSSKPLNYGDYREKIMLCESMNMTVHVVNGIENNVPYVREVACVDRYGATWNTHRMND